MSAPVRLRAADPIAPFVEDPGFFVLDGGLATELEARGHDLNDPLWSARVLVDEPEALVGVHESYLAAGADCIATCTYQASFEGFRARGLDDDQAEVLFRRAVHLAVEARDRYWYESAPGTRRRRPLVAGSLGPYGAYLADGSEYRGDYDATDLELRAFHERRWHVVAEAGADVLACETMPSRREALVLASLLADTPSAHAWISFSCRDAERISDGTPLADVARELDGAPGLSAIGINCTAPELIEPLIARARSGTSLPIFVYPNSGGRWDAERKVWETPPVPVDWPTVGPRWRAAGAAGIGGCCRVSPPEIATLRRALEA